VRFSISPWERFFSLAQEREKTIANNHGLEYSIDSQG